MCELTVNEDVSDVKASERVYGTVWREERKERNIVIKTSEEKKLSIQAQSFLGKRSMC